MRCSLGSVIYDNFGLGRAGRSQRSILLEFEGDGELKEGADHYSSDKKIYLDCLVRT